MAKQDNLYSNAISYWQLGNFEQAKKTFKKLLKNNSPNAEVLSFIGILDIQMGNLNEGVASLKKAYLIDPTNINIKKNYANALVDLSNFQIEHNQISQALISLENSIDAFPDNEPAYMNLIKINIKQKNYLKVDEIFNAALEYLSNNSNLYFLYGNSLFDQKKYKEALSMYEKTLEIDKHFAESYFHQALCYEFLGDIETSLSKYDSCLNIKPGYKLALFNKAQLLLALGNFEEGWNLYQNRWSSKRDIGKYFFNQTTELKNIDSARNKNIFVWAEQGIGDQILYSSLLSDFKKLAPNLTVSIDKRLLKIYQKSFNDINFIEHTEHMNPAFDFHLPMGNLGIFTRKNTNDFINQNNSFLYADKNMINSFNNKLKNENKKICGLSWTSKNPFSGDVKSINFKSLSECLLGKNYRFIDLEYIKQDENTERLKKQLNLDFYDTGEIDKFTDLDSVSALISCCDIVITVSNSTAHLAGALGIETILLLPFNHSDGRFWYWSDKEKSKWYPSIRILSQQEPGNWSHVIKELDLILSKL